MALFRRKRKGDRRINQDSISVEIPVYGPHDTLCAQDYMLPDRLCSFEQDFERRCKEWLKNAEPDRYNCGYMDMLIDQMEREAVAMLDIQEADHQRAIYELAKIWVGDQIKAETKLASTAVQKAETDQELRRLEAIVYKGTAYEASSGHAFEKKEDEVYE